MTSLDDLYCSNMINSMRDYTPSFAKNISPFAVRDPQEKNAAASASPDQPGFPSSSLKVISTGLPASTGTMNQRPGESVDDGRYVAFICNKSLSLIYQRLCPVWQSVYLLNHYTLSCYKEQPIDIQLILNTTNWILFMFTQGLRREGQVPRRLVKIVKEVIAKVTTISIPYPIGRSWPPSNPSPQWVLSWSFSL